MVIYNVGSVREEPIKGNIWLFDSLIHLVLEVGNTKHSKQYKHRGPVNLLITECKKQLYNEEFKVCSYF